MENDTENNTGDTEKNIGDTDKNNVDLEKLKSELLSDESFLKKAHSKYVHTRPSDPKIKKQIVGKPSKSMPAKDAIKTENTKTEKKKIKIKLFPGLKF